MQPPIDSEEQENQPEPKLILGNGDGSRSPRARKSKESQVKLGVGRPKIAGGAGARKTASVKALVIPPGVVAANPPSENKKGKGRASASSRARAKRGVTDSVLPPATHTPMEDIKELDEGGTGSMLSESFIQVVTVIPDQPKSLTVQS